MLIGILFLSVIKQKKKIKIKRNKIQRASMKDRIETGQFGYIFNEIAYTDPKKFFNYMRMPLVTFNEIFQLVEPKITKIDYITPTVPAKARLSLTIRYLASGCSQKSVAFNYKISPEITSNIIAETCKAIYDSLKTRVFPQYTTEYWNGVSADFEKKWNYPNCLGAVDGKHVNMTVRF